VDIDALTSPNTRTFVGLQSNTPVTSLIMDTCQGAVQNEGIEGIEVAETLVIQVAIDIKPGSAINAVNLGSKGVIPAAILSSPTFDAPTEVDPRSLSLAGASVKIAKKGGLPQCRTKDVNHDGRLDLVCQFESPLALEPGDTVAALTGLTVDGTPIRGQDVIRIVP